MKFPKISIITPSFNRAQYLEQTIMSVLSQGYPNLEYIIIDGGSTDGSLDIIKKYSDQLAFWVSEPDQGMYHALQKGFERSTGEIMGWLNSDDLLHDKALFTIAEILSLPGINWMMGAPTYFDESGRCVRSYSDEKWSRLKFYTNGHAYIQQESTYWTRKLWNKAGGYISTECKLAGDFELWSRFFKYEKLYTPSCLVGGYRACAEGQLTSDYSAYTMEADELLKKVLVEAGGEWREKIQQLNKLKRYKVALRKSKVLNWHFITNRLDREINALYAFPAKIDFNRKTQRFEIE